MLNPEALRMRGIVFRSVPKIIESERDSTRTLMGAAIHGNDIKNAVLQFSSADRIYFADSDPREIARFQDSALFAANRDRIRFYSPQWPDRAIDTTDAVIYQNGLYSPFYLHLRRCIGGGRLPIASIIFTISYTTVLTDVLLQLMSSPRSYDAILCASHAGRHALLQLVRVAQERTAAVCHGSLTFRAQTPVIPYAVHTSMFSRTIDQIAHGAMWRHELGISADSTVILYMGRFSAISKADLGPLILAFAELWRDNHQRHLILAGDDHQFHIADDLLALASELNCSDGVHVVPNPAGMDKRALYATANVFVSPSDSTQETMGLTVVEAAAAGLPVVAADWDGYRDVVVNNVTGFLIPTILPSTDDTFDRLRGVISTMMVDDMLARSTVVDVVALHAGLRALCDNPVLQRRMGEAGQRHARSTFDYSAVVRKYDELFEQLGREAAFSTEDENDGENWQTYPTSSVFGHYATSTLSLTDCITIGPLGHLWRSQRRIADWVSGGQPWWDDDAAQAMVNRVNDEAVSAATLTRAQSSEEQLLQQLRLARLLKCGVLSRISDLVNTEHSEPTGRVSLRVDSST